MTSGTYIYILQKSAGEGQGPAVDRWLDEHTLPGCAGQETNVYGIPSFVFAKGSYSEIDIPPSDPREDDPQNEKGFDERELADAIQVADWWKGLSSPQLEEIYI